MCYGWQWRRWRWRRQRRRRRHRHLQQHSICVFEMKHRRFVLLPVWLPFGNVGDVAVAVSNHGRYTTRWLSCAIEQRQALGWVIGISGGSRMCFDAKASVNSDKDVSTRTAIIPLRCSLFKLNPCNFPVRATVQRKQSASFIVISSRALGQNRISVCRQAEYRERK